MSDHVPKHPLSRVLASRPRGPMRVPARALGWFSIAAGLAALAMPRRMAGMAGAPDLPVLTRASGVREIGTGIGILASKDPAPWLWGRVIGDALDVATVGVGLVTRRRPMRTLASLAFLLGVTWIDIQVAEAAPSGKRRLRRVLYDYSNRSGFPRPVEEMRGIATKPSMSMAPGMQPSPRVQDSRSAVASAVAGAAS